MGAVQVSAAIVPLKTVPVGKLPGPLVANPAAHSVFVLNRGGNTVSVLDAQSLKVTKTITVGSAPLAIAANPPANMVYVANSGDGTISAIAGTAKAVSWPVGGKPIALAVDAGLKQLYVADATQNQIEIVNADSGAVIAAIPTKLTPVALALNIATHDLFVACTGNSGSVVVIDGAERKVATTVKSLPADISSISVDPMTNVAVLVSPSANKYVEIDAANGYAVTSQGGDGAADPDATAYDPGLGGAFFFGDSGDGNVFFSGGNGKVTLGDAYFFQVVATGALAVNPNTNVMAVILPPAGVDVANLGNPTDRSNYHELDAGKKATGLAFDPLSNRLFVSNAADDTVSTYDTNPEIVTAASECSCDGDSIDFNYIDTNPATGTTYTLRLGNLYAINEAQAGAGTGGSSDGVTAIPLGGVNSAAVTVNSATNKIYAGDGAGLFYAIDGGTNVATPIGSVPAAADIRTLAVDYATNEIVAWDGHSNVIDILDSATDALVHTVPLTTGSSQTFVAVDSAKNRAYAVNNEVTVINPSKGTIVTTIPLGALSSTALQIALNPAGDRLYVYANDNTVYVIDTEHNSQIAAISRPGFSIHSVGVNPLTGTWYVGGSGDNALHVLVYDGSSNTLKADLSSVKYSAIEYAESIVANPLTDTVYIGTIHPTGTAAAASIDGRSNTVAALPSTSEKAADAMAVDLGSGVLAGAGYSYTNLWFPGLSPGSPDLVPIAVTAKGTPDAGTIATGPIFRTHNTQPGFTLAATNTSPQATAAPTHAFYQVDGWQGKWSPVVLKAKSGSNTSHGKITLPSLSTGRHILYIYAVSGDVATVQDSRVGSNSPVISPIAATVFTVED